MILPFGSQSYRRKMIFIFNTIRQILSYLINNSNKLNPPT